MMKIKVVEPINIKFIYYVLSSYYTREYFRKNATGTSSTMPKINQSIVANTLIPLPPINEQNRIVMKIEELLKYFHELDETIKLTFQESEKLIKAILQKTFTNRIN
ncbi:restriction endonuclease subunit S [Neobacillus muris]|uniref:restriction endonuclease subunit S n=1 Tax=Neobacillus muris TaxID=2941334 RepID=UPI00203AC9BE|nr:restriction endonuclease subunit S [Neobacillus muris]